MRSGIGFRVAGSSMEMWNTGCTAQRLSRSRSVMEWVPGRARISYSPRNFSASFLDGRVVQKNWVLMYAWLPILNSGAGSRLESAELGIDVELQRYAVEVVDAAHRGQ